MDNTRQYMLQKELEMYSGLLMRHKTAQNHQLASSSVHQLSKDSGLKQLTLSGYKYVKNSNQDPTSKYLYNKFNQSRIKTPRTVLYNNSRQNTSKYKLTTNKTISSCSPNEVMCQRTVLNKHVPSASSGNETSDSHELIKQIESITAELKKTLEKKTKDINSSTKTLHNSKSSFKYCAVSNLNVTKNKSMFSKINDLCKKEFKIKSNGNSTVVPVKQSNDLNQTSLVSDERSKNIFVHPNSSKLNKYCYKKSNREELCSKTAEQCSAFETIDKGNHLNSNIQKSISQPHLLREISQDDAKLLVAGANSSDSTKLLKKPSNPNSNLKLGVSANPVMSRTKINNFCQDLHKSQNLHKLSGVVKINCTNSKYKRINANNSVILSKNPRLKNASHLRSPFIKKNNGKINSKFKVINKTATPCVSKKLVFDKSSFGCKENSPLVVDKSDPLFKYLNDSTVDKLEKDLLAISTTLTSSPTTNKSFCKGVKIKHSKIDRKLNHKQMSLKKSKSRISKYKVVNSAISPSSVTVNKPNFTNRKNVKKTKFSIINKHTLPVHITPMQEKTVLIKRLYKSKNAIINKNASSTYYSAKMIKCKYFTPHKRKLSCEKSVLYSKVPFLKSNSKGYLSAKVYYNKSRPRKSPIIAYNQRAARNFSRYGYTTRTAFNRSGKNSLKKFHCGYHQSPVVFIRGLKYSRNSSGKTLRKLPAQGFTKIHQKLAFSNKRYVKNSENYIKALTPTSSHLASRVLHRSITRVLSASSKKKLIKVNSYCMFYNRFGRCNRGIKCTYIHDPSKIAVCTRFLRGTCKVDGCPFSHEITPGKMAICSFFLVGACDNENCPYRHENLSSDAELCKAFVQGYCPMGKKCQKAHILVCPKYIQGNCEKGTSCAFPHPPQKARKNVQKETEEESKQDALFEKVARYFQPNENTSETLEKESDDIAVVNVFVPKQKKLEEQPSFIPLSDRTIE